MKPYLLALLVAFVWGFAPIFEKLSLSKAQPLASATIRSVFLTCFLLVIFFIYSSPKEVFLLPRKTILYIILGGLFGGGIGLLLYFFALKAGDASRIVPLVATYPLFTSFFSFIILKEDFSLAKILGTILIIGGIFLIQVK